MKSFKFQAPSSKNRLARIGLEFGPWSFSGAWMLVLGVFPPQPFSPSHSNAPASELSRIPGSTAAIRAMGKKLRWEKLQIPSSNIQASSTKNRLARTGLELGPWSFSGAWMLELGAFPRGIFAHEHAN
jgi:hypothetical protein